MDLATANSPAPPTELERQQSLADARAVLDAMNPSREISRLRTALGENLELLKECYHYQNRLPRDCVLRLRAALVNAGVK